MDPWGTPDRTGFEEDLTPSVNYKVYRKLYFCLPEKFQVDFTAGILQQNNSSVILLFHSTFSSTQPFCVFVCRVTISAVLLFLIFV